MENDAYRKKDSLDKANEKKYWSELDHIGFDWHMSKAINRRLHSVQNTWHFYGT